MGCRQTSDYGNRMKGFDTPAYNVEINGSAYEDWQIKDELEEWMKGC